MRAQHALVLACALGALSRDARADLAAYAQPDNCHFFRGDRCQEEPARPLPTSVEQFLKLREQIGKTARGGAALFMYAMMVRLSNRALGEQLLVLSLDDSLLEQVGEGGTYKGYRIKARLMNYGEYAVGYHLGKADERPHCVRAYARGSRSENMYRLDPVSVGLALRENPGFRGVVAEASYLFLCSSGRDMCEPVPMLPNQKGYWKVAKFPTLFLGCRDLPPPKKDDFSKDL